MPSYDDQAMNLEPICEAWFQHFFERRHALIRAYERGDLNKKEFLQSNLKDLDQINARPFLIVDRLEKGIFNYQYYNALAKRYRIRARQARRQERSNRKYGYFLSLAEKYYGKKDETILDILEFLKYRGLYGYFVHCDDARLQNRLFEIVFIDYPEFILHSKSEDIYRALVAHDVFIHEKKRSKIESYINDRY